MKIQVNRTSQQLKTAKIVIWTSSIAVPMLVAILFGVKIDGVNLNYLPAFYSKINAITAVLLVGALVAVKMKQYKMHQRIMQLCILLSLVFLGCYVAYHMVSESTVYGDLNKNGILEEAERIALGAKRTLYLLLLVSHIILSILVIPIVLFSYYWAWQGKYERHKKWTRFAWPIWMYVAVTGVIVYNLIFPFYK